MECIVEQVKGKTHFMHHFMQQQQQQKKPQMIGSANLVISCVRTTMSL